MVVFRWHLNIRGPVRVFLVRTLARFSTVFVRLPVLEPDPEGRDIVITESKGPVQLVAPHSRVYALIGVLLALGWPFAARLFVSGNGSRLTSVHDDFRTMAIEWSVVAVLAAAAFGLQKLRPQFFRLKGLAWLDVPIALGGLVAALVLSAAVSAHVAAPKFDLGQLASIPIAVRVGLVITAGICEEFIYRGFAIEELGSLTGNRWVGAIVSLALFSLGHIGVYGFSTALLIPATVGLVITLLYMFRNNLLVCMLVHGAMDGLFLILIPALMHR